MKCLLTDYTQTVMLRSIFACLLYFLKLLIIVILWVEFGFVEFGWIGCVLCISVWLGWTGLDLSV